jgi:hypothetical protein
LLGLEVGSDDLGDFMTGEVHVVAYKYVREYVLSGHILLL